MCDEPECDYDLFRDLTERAHVPDEHPLERALRTNDAALRCYFWEEGKEAARGWDRMQASAKRAYDRVPVLDERRVPSGSYYMYGGRGGLQVITEQVARANWDSSFRAR